MQPFYDPNKTYDENYDDGPFGAFADGNVWKSAHSPAYRFLGFPVDTPFGIPAGPLLNSNFIKSAFEKGFSVCVYKTVRSRYKPVNGFPNVVPVAVSGDLSLDDASRGVTIAPSYEKHLSITNSFGVPSKDPSVWQDDMKKACSFARKGQLLIGSFQGTAGEGGSGEFVHDCVYTATLVAQTGVKVLEMNTSCPNEGTSNLLCFDTERVETIVQTIKKEISLPLILKIAYFKDQEQLKEFIRRIGPHIDGISTINTIPAKIFDTNGNQGLPGEGRAVSGVCGEAIRWAGLSMVSRVKHLKDSFGLNFSIIGVGGVRTVGHVEKYLRNGADAVMSATGAMWNPNLGIRVYTHLQKRRET